jgi:hypothetical protein
MAAAFTTAGLGSDLYLSAVNVQGPVVLAASDAAGEAGPAAVEAGS